MTTKKYYLLLLILSITFSSCEDVIEVDVPSEAPRLIVDALIRVNTSDQFTNVIVKVQETNSFFETLPPANLNQITMVNLTNPQKGVYYLKTIQLDPKAKSEREKKLHPPRQHSLLILVLVAVIVVFPKNLQQCHICHLLWWEHCFLGQLSCWFTNKSRTATDCRRSGPSEVSRRTVAEKRMCYG